MTNKEQREIAILAERIKDNSSSEDVASLLNDAQQLYEKIILLKYNLVNVRDNTSSLVETVSPQKQITIDLFSDETVSVHDKATKKIEDNSVVEKQKTKKITDLRAAIGINEKFQFINELFEGNMKEYNIAVDYLNSLTTFSDAKTYLNDLKSIYKWKDDNPIIENFRELVERKF
ncbi:MAG: hypothetical protein V1781_05740 [Bacteroidota bacterium]